MIILVYGEKKYMIKSFSMVGIEDLVMSVNWFYFNDKSWFGYMVVKLGLYFLFTFVIRCG